MSLHLFWWWRQWVIPCQTARPHNSEYQNMLDSSFWRRRLGSCGLLGTLRNESVRKCSSVSQEHEFRIYSGSTYLQNMCTYIQAAPTCKTRAPIYRQHLPAKHAHLYTKLQGVTFMNKSRTLSGLKNLNLQTRFNSLHLTEVNFTRSTRSRSLHLQQPNFASTTPPTSLCTVAWQRWRNMQPPVKR